MQLHINTETDREKCAFELELELIQSHMAQKPVLWGEVGCACVAREVSVLGPWHQHKPSRTRVVRLRTGSKHKKGGGDP